MNADEIKVMEEIILRNFLIPSENVIDSGVLRRSDRKQIIASMLEYAALTLKDRDRELKDALSRNEKLVEFMKRIDNIIENSKITRSKSYHEIVDIVDEYLATHEKEQKGKG